MFGAGLYSAQEWAGIHGVILYSRSELKPGVRTRSQAEVYN